MSNVVILSANQSTGYEAITVSNTTGGIGVTSTLIRPTSGVFKGQTCQEVFCTLETAQIRWTVDGTAPTSSVGHLLNVGQTLTLQNGSDIVNFRAIRTVGDASLRVTVKH